MKNDATRATVVNQVCNNNQNQKSENARFATRQSDARTQIERERKSDPIDRSIETWTERTRERHVHRTGS